MGIALRSELRDQRSKILGQPMFIGRIVRMQHFRDAGNFRRRLRRALRVQPGDQHMKFAAQLTGRRDRRQGRGLQRRVVMFGENKNGHAQITFASFFSLSTSSSTVFSITPARRFGGSAVFSTLKRGAISTPSEAASTTSSGFFFAFMIFGSVA